jgi:hypothetical protein
VRAIGVSLLGALAVLAVSLSAAPAQAATGLEPGVHVDPGSPAAKEYSLPLNQARQTGAVATGNEGSSAGAPFGAGIHPPGSGGSSHPGSGAHNIREPAPRAGSGQPTAGAPATSAAISALALREASARSTSKGDGSLLTLIGGAVAILIVGAFGGTLMRRSRQSPPPEGRIAR